MLGRVGMTEREAMTLEDMAIAVLDSRLTPVMTGGADWSVDLCWQASRAKQDGILGPRLAHQYAEWNLYVLEDDSELTVVVRRDDEDNPQGCELETIRPLHQMDVSYLMRCRS